MRESAFALADALAADCRRTNPNHKAVDVCHSHIARGNLCAHGFRLAIIALDHHFELIILHTKPHGQLLPEFFDLVIQRDGL